MSGDYTDIVIDGELHSGSFHGAGIFVGKNMLRKLMAYKTEFPQSYEEINTILFDSSCGAGFANLKTDTALSFADEYIQDIKEIHPGISIENGSGGFEDISLNYPEFACLADSSGIIGEGSAISIAEKIILSRTGILYFNAEDVIDTDGVWSGEFSVSHIILSLMHTTRFAEKGWDFTDGNKKGDYMALASPEGDYSIIFVNNSPELRRYNVCIRCMGKGDSAVRCVETTGPEPGAKYSANWFRVVDKILPFSKSCGYCYSVEVKPNSIMTCTTLDTNNAENAADIFSAGGKSPEKLPYVLNPENGLIPISEIYGSFDIEKDNGKAYIAQTETYNKENAALAVMGSRMLMEYRFRANVLFADNDSENYAGIGILCDSKGRSGYKMNIFPKGEYEIIDCHDKRYRFTADIINADKPNKLEISMCSGIIIFKINDQAVYNLDITVTPSAVSGQAAVMSALRRNLFSDIAIENCEKRFPYCVNFDCLGGSIGYSGEWSRNGFADERFSHRTSVSASGGGQFFDLDFTGENIALIGHTDDLRAKVEIDGEIVNAGDVSESNSMPNEAFFIVTRLENKLHTMKFTVLSGELELDCVKVYSSGQQKIKRSKDKQSGDNDQKRVKLGTLIAGAGLAVAGLGVVLLGKKVKKRNKDKK